MGGRINQRNEYKRKSNVYTKVTRGEEWNFEDNNMVDRYKEDCLLSSSMENWKGKMRRSRRLKLMVKLPTVRTATGILCVLFHAPELCPVTTINK